MWSSARQAGGGGSDNISINVWLLKMFCQKVSFKSYVPMYLTCVCLQNKLFHHFGILVLHPGTYNVFVTITETLKAKTSNNTFPSNNPSNFLELHHINEVRIQ